MQNFQNELQNLGLDPYQVGDLTPITYNDDSRQFLGGFGVGFGRCGGFGFFRCFNCFNCFNCFRCSNCFRCHNCHRCWG